MKKKYFIILTLFWVFINSKAQTTLYKLPVYFGQFYNDPFLNSENLLDGQKGFATVGHRRNSDNFGAVNTSFAAGQYKLGDINADSYNEAGLHFFNDNEGPILTTTRAYFNFSRNVKLNDVYKLAGGLSFGFYNFAIKSDGTNEGISKITFDGSALFKMYSEKTSYSFIINQAYNSSIQPFQEKKVLIRNLNLFWNRGFKINDNFKSENNLIVRWSRNTPNFQSGLKLGVNSQLIIAKYALVGITFIPRTGNYYSLGMNEIPGLGSKLGFEISYLNPVKKDGTTNLNQVEITLSYKFEK